MLQQWLRDRCVPAVATVVSGDADLICRKNNVNFEQLVRCHVLVAVCVHPHPRYQACILKCIPGTHLRFTASACMFFLYIFLLTC